MPAPRDYVVVGAGSAGCLLAARLSEDPRRSVLLLEAGADLRPADEPEAIRGRHPSAVLSDPDHAGWRWDEIMARRGLTQPYLPYPRGRGVGGSSIVNGHAAIRGECPDDYDAWAHGGCAGWSGAEVLPHFIALERDEDFGAAPYHGDAGPLPIGRPPRVEWSPLDRAFADAALAAGHPFQADVNAPGSTGLTPLAHALADNRRVSASAAFLEPARERGNLEVRARTPAERIVFDGERTVGVLAGGQTIAAREVILAAGAIFSPALLMRSGIGPAEHLAEFGIPCRRDAPVGDNLLDHAMVWLGVRLRERPVPSPTRFANVQVRYHSGLAGAGANDMLLGSMNIRPLPDGRPIDGALGASTWQQFSRGRLRLLSADPEAMPELDMRMLSDPRDLMRMRDGVRRLWELRRRPELDREIAEVVGLVGGERIDELPQDDGALDEWLVASCLESAHVCGTCRMGARDDPRSVLDSECRVIGVTGLRVIDASVFPEVPRGNTQIPTLMVAERMASRLRRDPAGATRLTAALRG